MPQLHPSDLKPHLSFYESSREVGSVLLGDDTACPLLEAASSGATTTLSTLLSSPQWTSTMLSNPHTISSLEIGGNPHTPRRVQARPTSNIERCLMVAVENGHAAVTSTLLDFAKAHSVESSDILTRQLITAAIGAGDASVFRALAAADPNVITYPLPHGARPLYEAVRRRKPDLVAALLELGADPLTAKEGAGELSYHTSLMCHAALCEGTGVTEMLLERGVPLAQTGALHTAAKYGRFDTIRLLLRHGADVNEVLLNGFGRTPLHFAAWKGQVEAMKLLEENGARGDIKDEHGKTAQQLLEEA